MIYLLLFRIIIDNKLEKKQSKNIFLDSIENYSLFSRSINTSIEYR